MIPPGNPPPVIRIQISEREAITYYLEWTDFHSPQVCSVSHETVLRRKRRH